jgi:hypothetical protein
MLVGDSTQQLLGPGGRPGLRGAVADVHSGSIPGGARNA